MSANNDHEPPVSSSREPSPSAGGVALTEGEAKAQLDAADRAVALVEKAMRDEVAAARVEIEARHRETVDAARAVRRAAAERLRIAKDAVPDHPWTGKIVTKTTSEGPTWSRRVKVLIGVVETVRSDTVFPNNVRYRRPRVGDPLVRLLGKNGKPGLRFDDMRWGWSLADTTEPQPQIPGGPQ